MKITRNILLLSLLLALVACSNNDKLIIQGVASGGEGDTISIKHLVNNQLTTIESSVLKSNEKFKFSLDKQNYPDYYFLQIANGAQLVIVRDSLDVITIEADAKQLDKAIIKGSPVSVQIQETVNKVKALRAEYTMYTKAFENASDEERQVLVDDVLVKIKELKAFIGAEIYQSPRSYYSYFALFQRLDNENLLFSPYNEDDYKYFAAVATAYDVFQKDDPRTTALYDMVSKVLEERRKQALQQLIDEAPSGMPDIVMKDHKNVERKLSDLKGKLVILNFWASANSDSRAFNKDLLALYKKYKNQGVTVFQVSADKSRLLWQEAIEADQLPWTNVCDFKVAESKAILYYNVKQLPATFIVDRDGVLVGKYTTISDLEEGLKELI